LRLDSQVSPRDRGYSLGALWWGCLFFSKGFGVSFHRLIPSKCESASHQCTKISRSQKGEPWAVEIKIPLARGVPQRWRG
jgi:hypothetical protein